MDTRLRRRGAARLARGTGGVWPWSAEIARQVAGLRAPAALEDAEATRALFGPRVYFAVTGQRRSSSE